ncbi:lipocalin family protein [Galbibacter pacificus]|uniref:Lipocalin family protein n=1 Tax=Galbibacter pacificus TaxID=2996052 RepID=A0ABT6FWL8_9FLAO|nr:lipocalin family protein [Galbibacter pacificus]MDG3584168.1 lipocalin family protein [Galbibacter pacificus]MDG3587651.1 lipocalin family protein [Galbibacter pacificus]
MVTVMSFVACSSDDDNSQEPTIDPIVGKWYQIEERQIVNGEETTFLMNACEKMDNFDIKEDGTILSTFHYRDVNDECQKDGSQNIDWMISAEGVYTFTYIEDDGYTTEVKLEGETLIETYTYTSGDSSVQDIHVYSMTPDESGDDEGVQQEDPVIGKWQYTKAIEYMDGEQQPSELSECEKQSTIEFKVDGTLTSEFFDEDGTDCVSQGVDNLQWENKGEGVYETRYENGDKYTAKITFNKNTFTSEETYVDGENTYTNVDTYTKID